MAMNDFWIKLGQQSGFSDIPKSLIAILSVLGFDSSPAFAYLDESDFNSLYNEINCKANEILRTPGFRFIEVKNLLIEQANRQHESPGDYRLSTGHKNVIKAIAFYCKSSNIGLTKGYTFNGPIKGFPAVQQKPLMFTDFFDKLRTPNFSSPFMNSGSSVKPTRFNHGTDAVFFGNSSGNGGVLFGTTQHQNTSTSIFGAPSLNHNHNNGSSFPVGGFGSSSSSNYGLFGTNSQMKLNETMHPGLQMIEEVKESEVNSSTTEK